MDVDLIQLIESTKGSDSYETLSRRTTGVVRAGERAVNTSRFGQLGTMPLQQPPNVETVKGLAVALRVRESAVWAAVAKSLGIDAEQSALADMMPPGADDLPPSVIASVRAVVTEFVRLQQTATT